MAVQATYALYADWNNDGDYGDANEDISAYWRNITITRGYHSTLARYPSVGRMNVLVNNSSKLFSPPTTANTRPRRPVRLTMTYGGDTKTLFEGFIAAIVPASGTKRSRRAWLYCVDALSDLDIYEGSILLKTNVYADDIITDVVAAVYTPASTAYQAGINFFPTAADRWVGQELAFHSGSGSTNTGLVQTVDASGKILDACVSDWGRFFISKSGVPTYYNRHQMPLDTSTDLTLSNDMITMNYQMSDSTIYNHIEVTCHPRTVGTVYEVLGAISQTTAPMLEVSGATTFDISFRDPANNAMQLGGKGVLTPVAVTDYSCTSDEAGEGDDETANVTPTMTAYGDRVEITMTNDVARTVFIQKLQVRGYAVRIKEPITITAVDNTSVTAYGKRRLAVDAVLMSTDIDAKNLADYLLAYYKDPKNDMNGIQIIGNVNATLIAAVKDLELMNRVVITESQTGLSSTVGYIKWLHHTINNKWEHRLTFNLEEAYDIGGDPILVDAGHVDGPEILIY